MCVRHRRTGGARARSPIRDCDNVATSFPGFERIAAAAGLRIRDDLRLWRSVPVIAIDGPSASGKGTVAARVAQRLGFHYLDSGALYRLVALAAMRAGVALDDEAAAGRDRRGAAGASSMATASCSTARM